jgi:hypothetical protein
MASHTAEHGHGGKSAGDADNGKPGRGSKAVEDASEMVGDKSESAPHPDKRYSRAVNDKLHDAADYVHGTDVQEMGRDAINAAKAYPLASLLVLGAVVIGGSILVATLFDDDLHSDWSRKSLGLSSAASGLGPKGKENVIRIRDAAFGFALAKAVEMADNMWPGFKEHYDKA